MSETIRVMLPEDELDKRITELGEQISKDYEGESVFLCIILKGAAFFGCELAKRITVPVTIDFMATSSYGSGTVSTGEVQIKKDLDLPIEGKNVIIVEDIVDSGITLNYLIGYLQSRGAKSIKICSLLNKQCNRKVDLNATYIGFEVDDLFIVGYGLDFDQRYRNLPYITYLEDED